VSPWEEVAALWSASRIEEATSRIASEETLARTVLERIRVSPEGEVWCATIQGVSVPTPRRVAGMLRVFGELDPERAAKVRVLRPPGGLSLDLVALFPGLEQLHVGGEMLLGGSGVLARCPRLRQVHVFGLAAPLPSMPQVRELTILGGRLPLLEVGVDALEKLVLSSMDDLERVVLAPMRALASLELRALPALRALEGLDECEALWRLEVRGSGFGKHPVPPTTRTLVTEEGPASWPPSLRRLHWLGEHPLPPLPEELESLAIERHAGEDLRVLAGARRLRRLRIASAPSLTSLGGLGPEHASLQSISITGAPIGSFGWEAPPPALETLLLVDTRVPTLDGLAGAPLRNVVVRGDRQLVDVGGLANAPLERLDVRGCVELADLSPLAGIDTWVDLRVGNTKVRRYRDVPAHAREVVRPRRLRRKTRAERDVPRPDTAKGALRTPVARLKKLLRSRDVSVVAQGAELLASLGSPEASRALAGGVRFEKVPRAELDPPPSTPQEILPELEVGALRPNALFDSGRRLRPIRQYALRRVLASAPSGSEAARLREEVTELALTGATSKKASGPVHLAGLERFSKLRRLVVVAADGVEDLEVLPEMPALEELVLASIRTRAEGLPELPRLRELRIDRWSTCGSVRWLERFEGLRALTLTRMYQLGGIDVSFVPGLRKLSLAQVSSGRYAPPRVPAALRELVLRPLTVPRLDGIVPQLEALALRFVYTPHDLGWVPRAPRLERLSLEGSVGITALETLGALPRLRELDLSGLSLRASEVRMLEGMTTLERVVLRKTKLGGARLRKPLSEIAER